MISNLFANSAVEPSLTVNPRHKEIVAVAYQQSRRSTGGAVHCPVAISFDNGKEWKHYNPKTPDLDFKVDLKGKVEERLSPDSASAVSRSEDSRRPERSEGTKVPLVSDPWLSFRSDGKYLFLIELVFDITNAPNGVAVRRAFVNRRCKQLEWDSPIFLQKFPDSKFQADKCSITCDVNPRFVHAVWQLDTNDEKSTNSVLAYARSEDGGKTFCETKIIYDASKDIPLILKWASVTSASITNPIAVSLKFERGPQKKERRCQKSRTLIFFTRYYSVGDNIIYSDIAFLSSDNHGEDWSDHPTVAVHHFLPVDAFEPDKTIVNAANPANAFRTGSFLFSVANHYDKVALAFQQATEGQSPSERSEADDVKKRGEIPFKFGPRAKFEDPSAVSTPQVFVSFSKDDLKKWSWPQKVNTTDAQSFLPAVALTKKNLYVSYYDFRSYSGKVGEALHTDVWLDTYRFAKDEHGSKDRKDHHHKKHLDLVSETRLTKEPFDFRKTVVAEGYFVGDYQSIGLGVEKEKGDTCRKREVKVHSSFGAGRNLTAVTKIKSVRANEATHPRLTEILYTGVSE